jgi:hypothetical protein
MFLKNFGEGAKAIKLSGNVTTGTSAVNTSTVDTAGYEGLAFLVSIGAAASNNSVKVQDGDTTSPTTDLAGSSLASDGTATDFLVDILRPQKRYHRLVVTRGTTTTVDAIWAILYNPRTVPVSNVTTAQLVKQLVAPAEGTA